MKTTRLITLLTLLAVLLLQSCDGGHCIRGNRDLTSEYRSVEPYSGLQSEGSWDVVMHYDTIHYVLIEAESNLLPYISTQVKGNDLIVKTRDHRCINNRLPITIHVYTPELERASLEGSGNINIEQLSGNDAFLLISGSGDIQADIQASDLTARISGSGEMVLEGSCDYSEMEISGSGNIRAYNLVQGTCFATISGSGDMYLNVTTLLDVRILGSGDVH
ncbi:MAG TPA: head GIN domain-containing protein, partial [Bacteroidales bacterium]|nr:head GIN domain-containing protein [Bacteroidales bacterium]